MSKLLERKMYQLLLKRHHEHIVMTEQKAERTKSVIEQINTGTNRLYRTTNSLKHISFIKNSPVE